MHIFTSILLLSLLIQLADGGVDISTGKERVRTRHILTVKPLYNDEKDELRLYVRLIYMHLHLIAQGIQKALENFNTIVNACKNCRTQQFLIKETKITHTELYNALYVFIADHENVWRNHWYKSIMIIEDDKVQLDLDIIIEIVKRFTKLYEMIVPISNDSLFVSLSDDITLFDQQCGAIVSYVNELFGEMALVKSKGVVFVDTQLYEKLKEVCLKWSILWVESVVGSVSERLGPVYAYFFFV
ncbi:hypothetical protein THOM_0099 [Trachipleistophora hominis]|uniref:Uncharacterized protein n=1 Tax=Trachipleistophora hominis TaxID=72359 RepID=L7JZK9_TRAHO|nr:hypothetical protein THOM_0099 [Trachipleistophora hominis]